MVISFKVVLAQGKSYGRQQRLEGCPFRGQIWGTGTLTLPRIAVPVQLMISMNTIHADTVRAPDLQSHLVAMQPYRLSFFPRWLPSTGTPSRPQHQAPNLT